MDDKYIPLSVLLENSGYLTKDEAQTILDIIAIEQEQEHLPCSGKIEASQLVKVLAAVLSQIAEYEMFALLDEVTPAVKRFSQAVHNLAIITTDLPEFKEN